VSILASHANFLTRSQGTVSLSQPECMKTLGCFLGTVVSTVYSLSTQSAQPHAVKCWVGQDAGAGTLAISVYICTALCRQTPAHLSWAIHCLGCAHTVSA